MDQTADQQAQPQSGAGPGEADMFQRDLASIARLAPQTLADELAATRAAVPDSAPAWAGRVLDTLPSIVVAYADLRAGKTVAAIARALLALGRAVLTLLFPHNPRHQTQTKNATSSSEDDRQPDGDRPEGVPDARPIASVHSDQ